jgi:hypothetical protein
MPVNALPLHSVPIAPLHLSGFGPDDFICIGLIALALVIVTFVVRGGERDENDKAPDAKSGATPEK